MRSTTAGDQVKTFVVIRQLLRITDLEGDVEDAVETLFLTGHGKHLGSEVQTKDPPHARGDGKGGVTGAGANVEREPVRLGLRQLDNTAEHHRVRVGCADAIQLSPPGEDGLNSLVRRRCQCPSTSSVRTPANALG